jgi:hypothetical protein
MKPGDAGGGAHKEITALAQTLGVRVPRKWLYLAADVLE